MKNNLAVLGAFVISGVLLFSIALFMIGNRNQVFNRHNEFYVEMANVNGITPGSKVRVDGYDSGQVKQLEIPERPSAKFRLKLDVVEKVHSLVRQDSLVTVESDGVVGDKFILIHAGSDGSPEAPSGFTLHSKEPIELSAMLTKASGVMDQANTMLTKATGVIDQANVMIPDVRDRLTGVLDSFKTTVDNTNGLVTQARSGKGIVGTLMSDQGAAEQVKQVVANAEQASVNLNQASLQAKQLVSDLQARDLPAKADDSLSNIKQASQRVNQVSEQVSATVKEALGADSSGADAGENLRETLSNVNSATANLNDDTEALKHNFFFRGFFKKRGFYSLAGLTQQQYRANDYFQDERNQRFWINAGEAFRQETDGTLVLSDYGRIQIDQMVGKAKDSIINRSIVVEGYSSDAQGARQVELSWMHAQLIARYLAKRFHLRTTDIGVVVLNAAPPQASGKSSWDGACVVLLAGVK